MCGCPLSWSGWHLGVFRVSRWLSGAFGSFRKRFTITVGECRWYFDSHRLSLFRLIFTFQMVTLPMVTLLVVTFPMITSQIQCHPSEAPDRWQNLWKRSDLTERFKREASLSIGECTLAGANSGREFGREFLPSPAEFCKVLKKFRKSSEKF